MEKNLTLVMVTLFLVLPPVPSISPAANLAGKGYIDTHVHLRMKKEGEARGIMKNNMNTDRQSSGMHYRSEGARQRLAKKKNGSALYDGHLHGFLAAFFHGYFMSASGSVRMPRKVQMASS